MAKVKDPYKILPYCPHRPDKDVLKRGDPAAIKVSAGDDDDDPGPMDFAGDVYQEIIREGVDDEGRQFAELGVVRFLMVGPHPKLGDLTVTLDASRPGVVGLLRAVKPRSKFPVVHTTRIHVIATASEVPGLVLQNQGPPLKFVSDPLKEWPPHNAVYRLTAKVRFEDRANPGDVVATASDGPVLVGVDPRG
jgi:hypothetical protein